MKRSSGWTATLDTMKRMEKFRGHFFNWYGTRDLRPLDPQYVSSVDSGNLAGHLIALGNACREMIARPVLDRQWLEGIEDTDRADSRVDWQHWPPIGEVTPSRRSSLKRCSTRCRR